LDLTGSGKTMLEQTVERLKPLVDIKNVIIVTNRILKAKVKDLLSGIPLDNILAEPVGRNTAPCIGWAAVHIAALEKGNDAIMAVMPSDHLVADTEQFIKDMSKAISAAEQGDIVTFGIKPNGPETGFGYIELKEETDKGIYAVEHFTEKPDKELANSYFEAGNYVWNSGMFFFSVNTIMDEIKRQMPTLYGALDEIKMAIGQHDQADVVSKVFPTMPKQSIDVGIMEHTRGMRCIKTDFGWSDLGSWSAAYDFILNKSGGTDNSGRDGNIFEGDVLAVESTGCMVKSAGKRLVAVAGVKDIVIVDTGDSVLICHRDKTQLVKNIVEKLEENKRDDLL
jgi:mannose-1-phosphate guanylyltransferase